MEKDIYNVKRPQLSDNQISETLPLKQLSQCKIMTCMTFKASSTEEARRAAYVFEAHPG